MAEPTQRQTLAALKHGPCCGGACDGARTTREQVAICRRDLADAIDWIARGLKTFRRVDVGDLLDFIDGMRVKCDLARDNARWLEEITLPAPERGPVPAEAATAIDEALERADPSMPAEDVQAALGMAIEVAFGGED